MTVKSKFISEDAMSCQKRNNESYDASNPAPKELKELAGLELELRKRKLLRELVNVERQRRKLALEIELNGWGKRARANLHQFPGGQLL